VKRVDSQDSKGNAGQHSGDPAEHRHQHRLDQELHEDVAAAGAHGLADADLPRALGDRHQHDVDNADSAQCERHNANAAQEDVHCRPYLPHHLLFLDGVPFLESIF